VSTTSDREPQRSSAGGVDPQSFKLASRQFATGVTVATTRTGDLVHAITATAFFPLSLDPPLVLLALRGAGRFLGYVRESGHMGVSVLSSDQQRLGEWASLRGRDPVAVLPHADVDEWTTGVPLIRDAVAGFDCVLEAEQVHGDHVVVAARVLETRADETRTPLLYFRGGYHDIGEGR
jgi:3-hydroxy-9,10-secoandrosta-1,3,5(10)-triene-9,17-dione monooxygenase reductase component